MPSGIQQHCMGEVEFVGLFMVNNVPPVSIHDTNTMPSHDARNSNGQTVKWFYIQLVYTDPLCITLK